MRCRCLCVWNVIGALVGFSLIFSPSPPVASSESAGLPPDRVDALVASIALYPDPLLAKLLIAATYPLEVDEAERWLLQHKAMTGAALDHAIASQGWDDSIKDLARTPALLSMMDDRLEWTQNLGDTLLAQPGDVLGAVQRLRKMALEARTLHSTSQQKVTEEPQRIVIEPATAQVIDVPFYDPQMAYGEWPHPMYPPMWWTPPRGYTYGPAIGFMTGTGVPAAFWRNRVDWDSGRLLVDNAVAPGDYNRITGTPWIHDPKHRRFVSYRTPELRHRYGRDFPSGRETRGTFRGYDLNREPPAGTKTAPKHGRTVQIREVSNGARSKARLNVFENIDQGASERLFSRRGNASIFAARRDNSHFAVGKVTAAAVEIDSVAAR